jgi:hypothetical protein
MRSLASLAFRNLEVGCAEAMVMRMFFLVLSLGVQGLGSGLDLGCGGLRKTNGSYHLNLQDQVVRGSVQ